MIAMAGQDLGACLWGAVASVAQASSLCIRTGKMPVAQPFQAAPE